MNKTGVLLIHGFAGDPEEIRPLRDYLERRDYLVACPLLPGHGLNKKELSGATHESWIASAEQAYLDLSKNCERVFVIGFSMGGLLAVNLWNYGFSGLVTVNMPVYYWNSRIILKNLSRNFRLYGRKYLAASTDKPFSSMIEFQRLLTKTKPMISNVTCRTMIVQAMDDDTVHCRSADYVVKKVRGEKTVYRLPHGGHMLFQSSCADELCGLIESFIKSC